MLRNLLSIPTLVLLLTGTTADDPYIWPLPVQFTVSSSLDLTISASFAFSIGTTGANSEILVDAVDRYTEITFPHHAEGNPTTGMTSLVINVASADEDLQFGIDESYTLAVPNATGSNIGVLTANTIYGAMRGLETFSQLVIYNFTAMYYETSTCVISDSPRFGHRGVMIDTSRHFQSIESIKRLLDAMSYSKFNTLHWHIVDSNSFPYESIKYPLLWEAAYSPYERFSQNDVIDIVKHAQYRGIRVIPEFDMPSHNSFCVGYPDLCPTPTCTFALDPSKNLTYEFLGGLFSEARSIFIDDWIHIGGDEPDLYCWTFVPNVTNWEAKNNLTVNQAWGYFEERAQQIAGQNFSQVINWVEVFNFFNTSLDSSLVIIQVWKAKSALIDVVKAGFRGILSDNDLWYLDNLGVTWDEMYLNEPFEGITNTTQQDLILGGETCMWGETVDVSDFEQTIWPRAAAVGERLWSPQSVTNVTSAKARIAYFRCLLNQRGIAAAPYNNTEAREAPPGPGSCYDQRR